MTTTLTSQDLIRMRNEAALTIALIDERVRQERVREERRVRRTADKPELTDLAIAFEKSRRNHPSNVR